MVRDAITVGCSFIDVLADVLCDTKKGPSEDGPHGKGESAGGFLLRGFRYLSQAGGRGLAAALARFLIVFVFAGILEDAGLLNLLLEPPKGALY